MPLDPKESMEGWVTAEDHRKALLALQLPLRRRILELMAKGPCLPKDLDAPLGLSEAEAKYHLGVLEGSHLVSLDEGSYALTPVGIAWLDRQKTDRGR